MKAKCLLLACFIVALTMAVAVAWYNVQLERQVVTGNRKFDVELIRQMIKENRLSGIEARHYEAEGKPEDAQSQ